MQRRLALTLLLLSGSALAARPAHRKVKRRPGTAASGR